MAARLIHAGSSRADAPFVAVNCGAIPENLMESEFFGYRKGAFTGAETDRAGYLHAAQKGTLFLDEVGDLPLAMQVKLLRVIQEKKFRRAGRHGGGGHRHAHHLRHAPLARPSRWRRASSARTSSTA